MINIKKSNVFKKIYLKIANNLSSETDELTPVINEVNTIRNNGHDTLAICLVPTGSSYLGVLNATKNLFRDCFIVLPAYYSQIKFTDKQLLELANHIFSLGFKQVVLSAFPASLESFATVIGKNVRLKIIYHGALSELNDEKRIRHFELINNLHKKGIIECIGFVKADLEKWYQITYQLPAKRLELFPITRSASRKHRNKDFVNIGIFGNNSFNKNRMNQIAAAMLVPNGIIHVLDDFQMFAFSGNIVIHPLSSHEEFLKLLSTMDINLHVSFSEGMGGQTFTESLAMGIPCLTSYNNQYLRYSNELIQLLTVYQYDNPYQIALKIDEVLKIDKNILSEKLISYSASMHDVAQELLEDFLF